MPVWEGRLQEVGGGQGRGGPHGGGLRDVVFFVVNDLEVGGCVLGLDLIRIFEMRLKNSSQASVACDSSPLLISTLQCTSHSLDCSNSWLLYQLRCSRNTISGVFGLALLLSNWI